MLGARDEGYWKLVSWNQRAEGFFLRNVLIWTAKVGELTFWVKIAIPEPAEAEDIADRATL